MACNWEYLFVCIHLLYFMMQVGQFWVNQCQTFSTQSKIISNWLTKYNYPKISGLPKKTLYLDVAGDDEATFLLTRHVEAAAWRSPRTFSRRWAQYPCHGHLESAVVLTPPIAWRHAVRHAAANLRHRYPAYRCCRRVRLAIVDLASLSQRAPLCWTSVRELDSSQ